MPREQRRDLLDRRARGRAAGEPEARRAEDAAVGLEHHHVVGELRPVALEVGASAGEAVLFVGEEHDAHRAARPQVELLHQPQRFPRHDAAAAVVCRAGADVPGIEVAADDDDFVGPLAAADLADDVRRVGIGQELGLHLQADADLRAAVLHALQALGVLDRDRGRRESAARRRRSAASRCAACAGPAGRPRG